MVQSYWETRSAGKNPQADCEPNLAPGMALFATDVGVRVIGSGKAPGTAWAGDEVDIGCPRNK